MDGKHEGLLVKCKDGVLLVVGSALVKELQLVHLRLAQLIVLFGVKVDELGGRLGLWLCSLRLLVVLILAR